VGNGQFAPGNPGRPKGSKNKFSRKMDEAFAAVFDSLQLSETTKLEAWAKENLTEFYKITAKGITSHSETESRVVTESVSEEQARREAEAFLESTRLAAQRVGAVEPHQLHDADATGLPTGGSASQDSPSP
jgi:hypothetical protein